MVVVVILADLPNPQPESHTLPPTSKHTIEGTHNNTHSAFVEVTIKKSANPARCAATRAREKANEGGPGVGAIKGHRGEGDDGDDSWR